MFFSEDVGLRGFTVTVDLPAGLRLFVKECDFCSEFCGGDGSSNSGRPGSYNDEVTRSHCDCSLCCGRTMARPSSTLTMQA